MEKSTKMCIRDRSEAESNSESDSEDLDEETMDFIKYNIYVEMNN